MPVAYLLPSLLSSLPYLILAMTFFLAYIRDTMVDPSSLMIVRLRNA